MTAQLLPFPSPDPRPGHLQRPPQGGAVVVALSDAAGALVLPQLLLLRDAEVLVAAWDEDVAEKRAQARKTRSEAQRMVAKFGPTDLSQAKAARASSLAVECAVASRERVRALEHRDAARCMAGLALSRLARPAARRAFMVAFGDVTAQRAGAAVGSLVREHRASLRAAQREAV